ncbi:MAG TPA: M56 family metallopeptidase [Thermoanaerobaculia bacterium]|nr:M56 family metallopeptidase [Thermoanaerobaculia bacterium]
MTAALASWLFAATWKGTLLVAFALVVHRVARNRIPSRWLCALLLVAVLRLLAPVAPATTFSVFNLVPAAEPGPPVEIVAGKALERAPRIPVAVRTATPPPQRPWIPLLLGLWATGAAFFMIRAVAQTVRFRRRLRFARAVDLGPLLDDCREALHLRRGVRVAVTEAVAAPSLHGWLRPMLLLPDGFLESFSREQLRYAVLHELAHLRRSDVLVNWIATAAAALHWFNPLVRLALARLAEERELACDELALAALRAEERQAYGGTVLEIVDRLRTTQLVPALVGMTATPQQLKRRIVMIASFKQPRYSVLFAAMVVAVGLVTLTDAQAHEPRVMHFKTGAPLSPEAHAIVQSLEKPVTLDLKSASVHDALFAITNATGVNFTITDGAVDSALRLNIQGETIPAHMVLLETSSAAGLAVKFTDTGVEILKAPAELERHPHGEGDRVMFMRKIEGAGGEPPAMPLREPGQRPLRFAIEAEHDGSSDVRKVTLRDEDGQTTGTLRIEVLK